MNSKDLATALSLSASGIYWLPFLKRLGMKLRYLQSSPTPFNCVMLVTFIQTHPMQDTPGPNFIQRNLTQNSQFICWPYSRPLAPLTFLTILRHYAEFCFVEGRCLAVTGRRACRFYQLLQGNIFSDSLQIS